MHKCKHCSASLPTTPEKIDGQWILRCLKHSNKISLGHHLAESYFVFQTDVTEDRLYLLFELGE